MPTELIIGSTALILLGIGVFGWVVGAVKTRSSFSSFERAIRQLYQLEEAQYPENELDQFYQELSMILCRYIEGRFGLFCARANNGKISCFD